jgi:hypothetical protein
MTTNNSQNGKERKFEETPKSPTASEILFKLRDMYGSKFEGFNPKPRTEKLRKFVDKKEIFYEMENGVEKGKKIIKE